MRERATVIVLMGPAGSGKSTIGPLLAARLGADFAEGDAFHDTASVARMSRDLPISDAARAIWIERLARAIDGWLASDRDVVLACSALRREHRRELRRDPERVRFVHLRAPGALLAARLEARRDHFAGPGLLESQLAAFEEPTGAITIDAAAPPHAIVDAIARALSPP